MAYSKVAIAIPKVTGNINISVTTAKKEVKNLFDASKATLNTRFTSSSTSGQNGVYITDYIDVVPGDEIYVKPAFAYDSAKPYDKINCYDSTSETKLSARVLSDTESSASIIFNVSNGVGHFTVPNVSGTTRIRIALRYNQALTEITKDDLANVIITKNEPIY